MEEDIETGLPPVKEIIDSIKEYRVEAGTEVFRYSQSGVSGTFEIYQNDQPFTVEIEGEETNFEAVAFVDTINLGTGNRDIIWAGINISDGELGGGVSLEQTQLVRNGQPLGIGAFDEFTGTDANYAVSGRDGIIFFAFLDEPRDVTIEQAIDPTTIPQDVVDRWSATETGALILGATTLRATDPDEVPLDEFFNLEGLSGGVSTPYPFSGFDAQGNPPTQYDQVVIPAQCCAFPIFREGYTIEGDPISAIGLGWSAQSFARRLDFGPDNDRIGGNSENEILNGWRGNDIIRAGDGDDVLIGGPGFDRLLGGDGNDLIEGGIGRDRINGGSGNDTLEGGGSIDRFIFDTNQEFSSEDVGIDTITDFQSDLDIIILDLDTFTALTSDPGSGFSESTEFAQVTTDADAETSPAFIVYNSSNGNLFYNANGSDAGLGNGGQFASLTGAVTLEDSNFSLR